MKILITGASGLLGPYLIDAFSAHEVIAPSRKAYDLTNHTDVVALLLYSLPDVVIHAAAETDVDYCEAHPDRALEANRDATFHLAGLLSPKSKLVYISTDMVYPDSPGPHIESEAAPINMYGRSKFAGEKVAAMNPRHLILRTNFVGPSVTAGRHSFSDWCIESLTDGHIRVFFNDVWFSPLHMKTLSRLILELVEADVCGIYNAGSRGQMSKAGFALALAKHKSLGLGGTAVGPAHFKTPRPRDLSLDSSALAAKGFVLPTVEEELRKL